MPYKSEKQRKFLHAKHPDIAERWDAEMKVKGKPTIEKSHKSKIRSAAQKSFGGRY